MKSETVSHLNTSLHSLCVEKEVAILRIENRGINALIDISESQTLVAEVSQIMQHPSVKVLMIFADSDCFSEEAYLQLLSLMVRREVLPDGEDLRTHFNDTLSRERVINLLNNFILLIYNAPIPVVVCYKGDVVTPFFGAGLAANYRYITNGSSIKFSHRKFFIHPSGALPYFLSKRLGKTKALDLLLKKDHLEAPEALHLGIIDGVLPHENFEKLCMEAIQPILQNDPRVIRVTKQLTHYSHAELGKYFSDIESDYHQS